MSVKNIDRRVQKTRRLLQDALIALIIEKGYSAVTVQDILDKANVGRSTFYLHYEDKQDLLHNCFEDASKLFDAYSINMTDSGIFKGDVLNTGFLLGLFRYIGQNHRLFKALTRQDSSEMFFHPIYKLIGSYAAQALQASGPGKPINTLQLELLSNYLTSALFGVLRWWLDKDLPCPPEEICKYFTRITLYDISDLLSLKT